MRIEKKSPWNDVSFIWKKIAAVLAAVAIISTFIVKVFHTPDDITYIVASALGVIFLMISWYADKQSEYTRAELLEHEKEANKLVTEIQDSMNELKTLALDTRKDTLRIQLSIYMREDSDNIDTILKLAQTYFVKLKGDWFMTNEFLKWAKKHDVVVPREIQNVILTAEERK